MTTTNVQQELGDRLNAIIGKCISEATGISALKPLLGGAVQEIWSFDANTARGDIPLVLRRANAWADESNGAANGLSTEGLVIQEVSKTAVPVPHVYYILDQDDGLGSGFVMQRVSGETIARKILRDDAFANVRPKLARRCGEILAGIHQTSRAGLPLLRESSTQLEREHYLREFISYGIARPIFELAFRWLEDNMLPTSAPTLVHGDFRNGNLIVGQDDVNAVLDWELAHLGDPMEDLGWFCVNSWRFGNIDHPAGGFGSREELFAGYESVSGHKVNPHRVHYWEVLGTLKWGLMCEGMGLAFASGIDRSVERGAIGRRVSETEIDLMQLLTSSYGVS